MVLCLQIGPMLNPQIHAPGHFTYSVFSCPDAYTLIGAKKIREFTFVYCCERVY